MINLLPPKNKEELSGERSWKLIMILGIVIMSSFICFYLILFSINIFISGEANVQKILFNQQEAEFISSNDQDIQGQMAIVNDKLVKIDSFYKNKKSFIKILEKVSGCIPSEIYLTNISIDPLTGPERRIGIAGFSPNREKLLELKANLEKEESFSRIDIPSFNWLKPEDINFSISVTMK